MVIPVDMTDIKAKRDKQTEEKEILYPEVVRRTKRSLERIVENASILEVNKRHAKGFLKSCEAKGLSQARICINLQRLFLFSSFAKKDFRRMKRADIDDFIASLGNTGWTRDGNVGFPKAFLR